MADTDRDIFAAATADDKPAAAETTTTQTEAQPAQKPEEKSGPTRDEHGRFASQQEREAAAEQTTANKPAVQQEQPDHRVPLRELLDERERRQREAMQREALERELAALRRQAQPPPQPQPLPDLYTDPDAFAARIREEATSKIERQMTERFLNSSFEDAKEQHGEIFDKAFAALERQVAGGDIRLRDHIVQAPNPGRALMRWHGQQEALREFGSDPKAYQAKLRTDLLKDPEFRKQAMETWRAEATGNAGQGSGPLIDLPSVNRAPGSGNSPGNGAALSDRELFRSITAR